MTQSVLGLEPEKCILAFFSVVMPNWKNQTNSFNLMSSLILMNDLSCFVSSTCVVFIGFVDD